MDSSRDAQIEGWFVNLNPNDYEVTSPEAITYNCIAWAAGQSDAWWEPVRGPGYYWPEDAPWDDRVDSLVKVFQLLHFEVCESVVPEPGYEKIAIYGEDDAYIHAARQIEGGRWTSKLGTHKDIAHTTLDGLAGPDPAFGAVVVIMRRKIEIP
jgi:hypothetical protein